MTREQDTRSSREIVRAILIKYSSTERDETHCRMSDLERDLMRYVDQIDRQRQYAEDVHQAWLSLQCRYDQRKPFLKRIFGG